MAISANTPRQAVIYARVANVAQTNQDGAFEPQLSRCEQYARGKGYAVVARFSDQASGLIMERPGLGAMLKFLRERGNGIVIVADDLARLSRDVWSYLKLRRMISECGATLECRDTYLAGGLV